MDAAEQQLAGIVEMFWLSLDGEEARRIAARQRDGPGLYVFAATSTAAPRARGEMESLAAEGGGEPLVLLCGSEPGVALLLTTRVLRWRLAGQEQPGEIPISQVESLELPADGALLLNGEAAGHLAAQREDAALFQELLSMVSMQLPFRVGGEPHSEPPPV